MSRVESPRSKVGYTDLGPSNFDFRPELMNYLAHGWRFAGQPYFLAGTAAPDWLSVIDRKIRLRSRTAAEFVADPNPVLASIARGVVQHHADDAWFHATPAFNELSLSFAVDIRSALPVDEGFWPWFLGHILLA